MSLVVKDAQDYGDTVELSLAWPDPTIFAQECYHMQYKHPTPAQ